MLKAICLSNAFSRCAHTVLLAALLSFSHAAYAEQAPQKEEPPSKEAFAALLKETLLKSGAKDEIQLNAADFSMKLGERQFFLQNAFDEFVASAPAQRGDVVIRYLHSYLKMAQDYPKTFEEAKAHIFPAVRSRAFISQSLALIDGKAFAPVKFAHQVFAEHFAIFLEYDGKSNNEFLADDLLKSWKVDFDSTLKIALENLKAKSTEEFKKLSEGAYQSPWADKPGIARLLLDSVISAQKVKGAPVILVPNKDVLLLTGADDEQGLAEIAKAALIAIEKSRQVCGFALKWSNGKWDLFMPPQTSAAYNDFHHLQQLYLSQIYEKQRDQLQTAYKKAGRDAVAASFEAEQNEKTKAFDSLCYWVKNAELDLPQTDRIVFEDAAIPGEGKTLGSAPWSKVVEVMGEALAPIDTYPKRFHVKTFPTAEQLKKLTLEK